MFGGVLTQQSTVFQRVKLVMKKVVRIVSFSNRLEHSGPLFLRLNILDDLNIKIHVIICVQLRPSAQEAVISLIFLMNVLRDKPIKNCYNCLMWFQLILEEMFGGWESDFGTLFPWRSGRLTPTTHSRETWNLTSCGNRGADPDPLGRTCLDRLSQRGPVFTVGAFDVAKLYNFLLCWIVMYKRWLYLCSKLLV